MKVLFKVPNIKHSVLLTKESDNYFPSAILWNKSVQYYGTKKRKKLYNNSKNNTCTFRG